MLYDAEGKYYYNYHEMFKAIQLCQSSVKNHLDKKYYVRSEGTQGKFGARFFGKSIPVEFEIRWIEQNPHYTLHLFNGHSSHSLEGRVQKNDRTGENEILMEQSYFGFVYHPYYVCENGHKSTKYLGGKIQVGILHEIGHALLTVIDEYNCSSPYVDDRNALLNLGSELRPRYFDSILNMLNIANPRADYVLDKLVN